MRISTRLPLENNAEYARICGFFCMHCRFVQHHVQRRHEKEKEAKPGGAGASACSCNDFVGQLSVRQSRRMSRSSGHPGSVSGLHSGFFRLICRGRDIRIGRVCAVYLCFPSVEIFLYVCCALPHTACLALLSIKPARISVLYLIADSYGIQHQGAQLF